MNFTGANRDNRGRKRCLLLCSLCFLLFNFPAFPAVLQHVSSSSSIGQGITSGGTFYLALPEPFQAGNTIVVGIQGGISDISMTAGDAMGNAYKSIVTNLDAGNDQGLQILVATNVTAGARVIWLTNASGGDLSYVSAVASELSGVSGVDKFTGNHATSATITAGSFTPTITGDFLWQIGIRDSGTINTASFTPGSQANITWALLSTDTQDGTAVQCGAYASTSAINPTFTAATSAGFISCAVALFNAPSQGAARPAGIYIAAIHHISQPEIGNSFSAPETPLINTLQIPVMGNLLVQAITSAGDFILTNCTSSGSLTWTEATGGAMRNNPGVNENSQFVYAANHAAAGTVLLVTNKYLNTSAGATGNDGTILLYDIVGAHASPYDTRTSSTNYQTVGAAVTAPPSLTPSSAGNLVIGQFQQFQNTVTGVTTLLLDAIHFDGENLDGPQNMDQNGGWGHYHTPNTTAVAPTWSFGAGYLIQSWVADMISFKSAAGAPQVRQRKTQPAPRRR